MLISYKGYTGNMDVDIEENIIYGEVIDIKDIITFEGKTPQEAKKDFERRVDRYLEFCRDIGQEPDKPFSGKIHLRTTGENHRKISLAAAKTGKSINSWIDEALSRAAEETLRGNDNQESKLTKFTEKDKAIIKEQLFNEQRSRVNDFYEGIKSFLKYDDEDTHLEVMCKLEPLITGNSNPENVETSRESKPKVANTH
ncbi:MAG: type II toxin-antitoxin system HicB family antitoxin [Symploca sp. SIO3C6]|nr:type II toxin-antitoxin system HicB family antitoxin [Symploca sp. SIO3C6]NET05666.1 type II toxin-antitoxin system HicB family antitoxin [Symploca sp. SIO2B6]